MLDRGRSQPNLLSSPYHKDSNLLQSGELGLGEGWCPPCCVGEQLDRRTEHLSITASVPAHPQPFPSNLEGSHSLLHFHETVALPKEWNVSSRTLLILNTLKKKNHFQNILRDKMTSFLSALRNVTKLWCYGKV